MRKAVIVIALGISLIVAGSVVTAIEFASWTPYDIEENVADFNRESLIIELSFEDLGTDYLHVYNGSWMDLDYEDFIEGDLDYLDYDEDWFFIQNGLYRNSDHRNVDVIEDSSQEVGVVKVEYTYLTSIDNRTCGLDSISYNDKENRIDYRTHDSGKTKNRKTIQRDLRNHSRNERNSFFSEDNTTYLFPQCTNFFGWGVGRNDHGTFVNFRFTDELKAILKHKQVPVNMSKIVVTVNPKDSDRIINR